MTSVTVQKNPSSQLATMRCMEVWGGNEAVDVSLDVAGLDAYVWGRPFGDHTQGGDLHYLSSCATERIARMLVADVAGHGDKVGRISEGLRGLMRRYVNYIDQTRFVEELNRRFSHDRSAELATGTFATALMMSWFGPRRELGICNAGHPAPYLARSGSSTWRAVEVVDGEASGPIPRHRNLPFGVVDDAAYDRIEIQLEVGDRLLCFTDALIETLGRGSAREGMQVLEAFLNARDAGEDPHDLITALVDAVDGIDGMDDDLTIMILRPNGKEPWRDFSRRLGGPFRVLWAVTQGALGLVKDIPWPEMTLANLGGALFEPLNRVRRSKKIS